MPDDIPTVEPADSHRGPPRSDREPPPPPHHGPSLFGSVMNWLARLLFALSLLFNLLVIIAIWAFSGSNRLGEKVYAGNATSSDKIAIVRIEGPILEGFAGYAADQLKEAAQDDEVKAVVLVINSPGGSVTASDQLWKKVKDLRDGKWEKQKGPKPVVVAMASIAASGGYYIAAPAEKIYAEPTTITGSIGVYAPFLDLHKFAQEHGIDMNIIKKGELKASGSMFKEMTPDERIEYDEMLEAVFQRFMTVVREGRNEQQQFGKRLKYDLRDEIKLTTKDGKPYIRHLADGGIYTAEQAKQYGLIDAIGYLNDAISEAQTMAGMQELKVITYNRPTSLTKMFLGIRSASPDTTGIRLLDLPGATARMWYLTPGYELAGVTVPGIRGK